MTMMQTFGTWTQVTGWGTALASVADAGVTTSGQIDFAGHYAIDVGLTWDKDSAAGTGIIEVWLLPEINDGAAQDVSVPPRGGEAVLVVSTAAETTDRFQRARVNGLPEKGKFHLVNNSGAGLDSTSDLYYRFVDLEDA